MPRILLILIMLLLLVGCSTETENGEKYSTASIVIDSGTGCQYVYVGVGGIYPRMDHEGKQICSLIKVGE